MATPNNPQWSNPKHSSEDRLRALKMKRAGVAFKTIAAELDIPEKTIRGWIHDNTVNAPVLRDDRDIHEEHWRKDRLENARYWNDPNVVLLGDPPFHRSALAQKLKEQQRDREDA